MLERIDVQTRRFIASVVTTYIGVIVAIILAYRNDAISLRMAFGIGVVGLLVAAGAERFLTYGPLLTYRDQQLSSFFNDYLGMIEEDIEDRAPSDVEVRTNIMRPSGGGLFSQPTYSIAYFHDESDYDPHEFDLEFAIGEGCVGNVHANRAQQIAISNEYVENWDDSWNTTRIQDEVAGHLETIIGTPIYRPGTVERLANSSSNEWPEPIAVLIIDSENKIEEFIDMGKHGVNDIEDLDFKDTGVATRAVEHARNAGILL